MVFVLLMPRSHSCERGIERSDLCESAVNEQLDTGNKTGIIGGEEGDRLGDFARGANPAKRSTNSPPPALAKRMSIFWFASDTILTMRSRSAAARHECGPAPMGHQALASAGEAIPSL
jgi:hypothetical protein